MYIWGTKGHFGHLMLLSTLWALWALNRALNRTLNRAYLGTTGHIWHLGTGGTALLNTVVAARQLND